LLFKKQFERLNLVSAWLIKWWSFINFIFSSLIFPPVIMPHGLTNKHYWYKENKNILIYHFPCSPCWYVGNSSYEHQFNTSAHAIVIRSISLLWTNQLRFFCQLVWNFLFLLIWSYVLFLSNFSSEQQVGKQSAKKNSTVNSAAAKIVDLQSFNKNVFNRMTNLFHNVHALIKKRRP
jgi:hypothetical protein